MDASERYEQLIAFLSTHLPPPVEQVDEPNGIMVFRGGSPVEVIATLTHSSVIVVVQPSVETRPPLSIAHVVSAR